MAKLISTNNEIFNEVYFNMNNKSKFFDKLIRFINGTKYFEQLYTQRQVDKIHQDYEVALEQMDDNLLMQIGKCKDICSKSINNNDSDNDWNTQLLLSAKDQECIDIIQKEIRINESNLVKVEDLLQVYKYVLAIAGLITCILLSEFF